MNRLSTLVLFCLLGYSLTASGDSIREECQSKFGDLDVCKLARDFADDTARTLPMMINSNMTIQSVMADRKLIQFVVLLSYNREYLEELRVMAGVGPDYFENAQREAMNSLCKDGETIGAFIKVGGSVRYIYRFNDGEEYLTLTKTQCST